MHNQPFNLEKIDYKTMLTRKRRTLLIWSIGPSVVVTLLALWFILPMLLTHQAIGAYKNGSYATSRSWLTPLTWSSPEPFVAAFDSGTVDTRLGKYDRAETELTRALALAPKDKICMSAQNLVASLDAHAAVTKAIKESKVYKAKASIVTKAHPDCFKGGASQGGGGGSGDAQSESQAPSESQQQQLEQKEQEGRDRQAKYATEEEYDPSNHKIKPW